MNRTEHLFIVATEEAGELIQAISKLQRFGPDNFNPETPGQTNAYQTVKEFYELVAVIETLVSRGELPELSEESIRYIKDGKITRMFKYQALSEVLGRVNSEEVTS